jgi:hypothetical protein
MSVTSSVSRAALLLVLPAMLAAQNGQQNGHSHAALPLKHIPKPTAAAITDADLMTRLYIFADDSMQGRETGTAGHLKSTAYLAREAARLGLEPAGDAGTYFQTVPLVMRAFDRASTFGVEGTPLKPFVDYVPSTFRGTPKPLAGAQVIFGGVFGETEGALTPEQVKGKLVVFTVVPGGRGLAARAFTSAMAGAAGVAQVEGETLSVRTLRAATPHVPNIAIKGQPSTQLTPLTLTITQHAAERLLGGPLGSVSKGAMGKIVTGEIRFREQPAPARNVVAILRGSDPALRGEFVALGAHSDHTGFSSGGPTGAAGVAPATAAVDHDSLHLYRAARYRIESTIPRGERASAEQQAQLDAIRINLDTVRQQHRVRLDSIRNGADDDGSGSVTLLEIAEAFARGPKPKRSLLFVWHTGEEKGLLGSRWASDHLPVLADSVVAQLNMDMVGRGAAADIPGGGDAYLQLVGSRRLSPELGDIVEEVNKTEAMPFSFDYQFDANGHPENIYCRSDHYHYARYGIPVVFLTTGLHGDYHQVTDEPQYIDYPHMTRIAQFVRTLTTRVADLDHRPVVDKPKPDPNGSCRQ